jgi:hypothetical protein
MKQLSGNRAFVAATAFYTPARGNTCSGEGCAGFRAPRKPLQKKVNFRIVSEPIETNFDSFGSRQGGLKLRSQLPRSRGGYYCANSAMAEHCFRLQ